MPDEFGSPAARDATAGVEQSVNEVAGEYKEAIRSAKTEVLNRQLGSKKVSTKDQIQEYGVIREMPDALAQFFTDQSATLEEMVNYCFEMENKLRNA